MVPFSRTAAVFDVDDSLLDGNAGTIFTWYLYRQKVMKPEMRSRIPRYIYEYARRRLTEADMVELGSRCHSGLRLDELRVHARACFEKHLRKRITSGGLRQLRRHLLSGHFVLLASGSPQVIVEALGSHLGAHASVGTRTESEGGVLTERLIQPVVFRDGKLQVVGQLFERWGLDLRASWLYSDSAADTPLFEAVGHPRVVNPKDPFRAEAERRGWPVLRWAERRRGAEDVADDAEWGSWDG
jgi:HAD superfamily hydrolase (TIGR01490 family)